MNSTVSDYLAWLNTQDLSIHGITSVFFKLPEGNFDHVNGAQWLPLSTVAKHVSTFPSAGDKPCLRLDLRDEAGNEIRLDLGYKGGSLSMSRKEDRATGFFESHSELSELPSWADLKPGTQKSKFYSNGNPVKA